MNELNLMPDVPDDMPDLSQLLDHHVQSQLILGADADPRLPIPSVAITACGSVGHQQPMKVPTHPSAGGLSPASSLWPSHVARAVSTPPAATEEWSRSSPLYEQQVPIIPYDARRNFTQDSEQLDAMARSTRGHTPGPHVDDYGRRA